MAMQLLLAIIRLAQESQSECKCVVSEETAGMSEIVESSAVRPGRKSVGVSARLPRGCSLALAAGSSALLRCAFMTSGSFAQLSGWASTSHKTPALLPLMNSPRRRSDGRTSRLAALIERMQSLSSRRQDEDGHRRSACCPIDISGTSQIGLAAVGEDSVRDLRSGKD